jgi:hypothetical protein
MKPMISLAWKEWHEVRVFLWIALGIFIVLPIAGGLEALWQYDRRFEISATPWVFLFGGVLAIFVAVGATCRDFSGHLEDFWRSRPVSVTRWLLVKYLVGLAVVLAACVVPLALELAFNREKDAVLFIAWFPFLWAALYGIGFLTGCLVRRTAHAAMLALAAMLLVYFLPVVLPPLQWLNISVVTDFSILPSQWPEVFGARQLEFAAGMMGLAIGVLLMALLAVHRDWRIDSGRKMIYGSISAAVLILFASAAFQLGTNMPILRQIDVSEKEPVWQIQNDGAKAYVITRGLDSNGLYPVHHFRSIRLTDSGLELGTPIPLQSRFEWGLMWNQVLAPGHPATVYYVNNTGNDQKSALWLNVAELDKAIDKPVLHLWDYAPDSSDARWALLYAAGDRLYVIGNRLIILDITQPNAPHVISNVPFAYAFGWDLRGGDTLTQILPPVPELSPRQRLQAVIAFGCLEGDTLCTGSGEDLLAYRLVQLTGTKAVFQKIGEYKPTILENLFGSRSVLGMRLQNGLLYVSEGYPGATTNPHIDVFDARGPHPLRLIGHFAAPGVRTVFPMPDGTALVGGDKLWLIGPPPHTGLQ